MLILRLSSLFILFPLASCVPPRPPFQVGSPCGASLGDCLSSLHCVPLHPNCTSITTCPGTCQDLRHSSPPQRIYTVCGGWALMDDCDERIETCVVDPRNLETCGPPCDGMGICAVTREVCGGDYGTACPEGKVCFDGSTEDGESWWPRTCEEDETYPEGYKCGAYCFPLRYGSDEYGKSREWEVIRTDQDGYQGPEDGEPGEQK